MFYVDGSGTKIYRVLSITCLDKIASVLYNLFCTNQKNEKIGDFQLSKIKNEREGFELSYQNFQEDSVVAWADGDDLVLLREEAFHQISLSAGVCSFIQLDLNPFYTKIEELSCNEIDLDTMASWFVKFLESHDYLALFAPLVESYELEDYQNYVEYLVELQVKFKTLVHFCFDLGTAPEELEDLTASQRLAIFEATPFGTFQQTFTEELSVEVSGSHHFTESDTPSELESRLGIPSGLVNFVRNQQTKIYKRYTLQSTLDALSLEFITMVEQNFKLKQCKRCYRFFQIRSVRKPDYCDYVGDGSNQTCQQIIAGQNFLEKNKHNEPLKIYKKYYKRYHERTKVNTIKRDVFETWSREACVKRDLCTDGKMEVNEFELWCHESFPNRERKK